MRFLQPIFLFTFLLVSVVSATTHVAVLETISEKGVIGRSEKMFLTDELRKRANVILPEYMGFVIMTRENINAMLPPGKTMEDCEGTCLVETGKNISADYVAQARVGKFGKQLTLTMELYETAENKLVGSFTARKPDAEGLLEEIEHEADAIFQKILGTEVASTNDSEGISSISTSGKNYQASGTKNYIVRIESSPTGALFSIDGRINASCNKTPCEIMLTAGLHRFSFSMEMYFDKDEAIIIQKNQQIISTELTPNFGELTLTPVFEGNMGDLKTAIIKIDGKEEQGKKHKLTAGLHKVQISHKCYESITFDVTLKKGSHVIFDQRIKPIMGGLEMQALFDGKQKAIPVFVNNQKIGETPFLEAIPICAKVQVGTRKENIPVKLKAAETIKYTYKGSGLVRSWVDDRDEKIYKTVKIGKQIWMAQNLNYKTINSYCYNDDQSNCLKYGRLYKWEAALDACPLDWHLPKKEDFEKLFHFVGGKTIAGGKLKSASGWNETGNGTDDFFFSASPAGDRRNDGSYDGEGEYAAFWTSTEASGGNAYYIDLNYNNDLVNRTSVNKHHGFSVRCIKDD